jgi:hypothetical protein
MHVPFFCIDDQQSLSCRRGMEGFTHSWRTFFIHVFPWYSVSERRNLEGAMSKENLIVELQIISEALHQTVNDLEGDQEKICWGKACVAVDTLINMVKQREEKAWKGAERI